MLHVDMEHTWGWTYTHTQTCIQNAHKDTHKCCTNHRAVTNTAEITHASLFTRHTHASLNLTAWCHLHVSDLLLHYSFSCACWFREAKYVQSIAICQHFLSYSLASTLRDNVLLHKVEGEPELQCQTSWTLFELSLTKCRKRETLMLYSGHLAHFHPILYIPGLYHPAYEHRKLYWKHIVEPTQ